MNNLAVSSIVDKGVKIGEGTTIGYFTHVLSGTKIGNNVRIGDRVYITHNCFIGDDVQIGSGTCFTGTEARSKRNIREPKNQTVVEDGVIIGSNVTIVGDTTIKKGAIIADGSTVIGYVWSETFVAGNPARKIYSLSSLNAKND